MSVNALRPIAKSSRPKLTAKARLRFDRRDAQFLLLYPERGLLLNGTASDILNLCSGRLTVGRIVELLATRHDDYVRELIQNDIFTFLSDLRARGIIEWQP